MVATNVSAAQVELALQEKATWAPTVEIVAGVHSGSIDDDGSLSFRKPFSNQSVLVGVEKAGTGFYVQAENFTPSENEARETDFYVGFYTEFHSVKVDVGGAYYWTRETGELDFHAAYAKIDLPSPFWQIVPFMKAEYRFAKKVAEEGIDDNDNVFETKTSMDGFIYQGGLRRDFQLHKRVNLTAEVSVGGNTGIYGMPAENLAFAREKLEISISLAEWLKLKVSALTQQNLGLRDGIAADTDKLFVGTSIVVMF